MADLTLLADGSAGDHDWGTGVYCTTNDMSWTLGGRNAGMGGMQRLDGGCDSGIAESLALVHALKVSRILARGRDRSLMILVDQTAVLSSMCTGKGTKSASLQAAMRLLYIGMSKALGADGHAEIKIVHKRELGFGDNWPPDGLATEGRLSGTGHWTVPDAYPDNLIKVLCKDLVRDTHGCLRSVTLCQYGTFMSGPAAEREGGVWV